MEAHDDPPPDQQAASFEIEVAPEQEVGTYANFLSVWHSPYEFTLDFCVTQQPQAPEAEGEPFTVPSRLVARLKIPPPLVFLVMQALNTNMARYESNYGAIKRPEEPEGDPDAP